MLFVLVSVFCFMQLLGFETLIQKGCDWLLKLFQDFIITIYFGNFNWYLNQWELVGDCKSSPNCDGSLS
jgi:hypothetical protein